MTIITVVALYIGYGVLCVVAFVLPIALFFLVRHTIFSFIFLHRMNKQGRWLTNNWFKKFWYCFTFDADKAGNVFFPGREWKD